MEFINGRRVMGLGTTHSSPFPTLKVLPRNNKPSSGWIMKNEISADILLLKG